MAVLVFNSELCIKWQNMLKEFSSSSNTMSIAIFAILLNTLERTHKRNTKKCLELALKCLKLAELVKNGTNLLLFTAFTTICISQYGKTSKCRIGTC